MSINKKKHPSDRDEAAAEKILQEKRGMPGALLPILHALQEKFGYILRRNLCRPLRRP